MGWRAEGTAENSQSDRGSGSGRGECAPRRTREKVHLVALSKLTEKGALQPTQIGGSPLDAGRADRSTRRRVIEDEEPEPCDRPARSFLRNMAWALHSYLLASSPRELGGFLKEATRVLPL